MISDRKKEAKQRKGVEKRSLEPEGHLSEVYILYD